MIDKAQVCCRDLPLSVLYLQIPFAFTKQKQKECQNEGDLLPCLPAIALAGRRKLEAMMTMVAAVSMFNTNINVTTTMMLNIEGKPIYFPPTWNITMELDFGAIGFI
jgi:hypothetical protein